MKKINLLSMMLICILLMILWSCSNKIIIKDIDIRGTWYRDDLFDTTLRHNFIINDDSTGGYSSFTKSSDFEVVNGFNYILNNDTIKLKFDFCPKGIELYRIKNVDSLLIIELIESNCNYKDYLPGTYRKY